MWRERYVIKEGTSATFILQRYLPIEAIQDRKQKQDATARLIVQMREEGQEMLLPFRICFITGDAAPISNTGRGAKQKVAQMKACFTRLEESPYKLAKPYKVCTAVWEVEGHKCFFFGTVGITFEEGQKPLDNGDLIVFYTTNWKEVEVFIFKGLVQPNEIASLQEAVQFVEDNVILG